LSIRASVAVAASLLALATPPAAPGQTTPAPGRDSFWFGAGLGVGSEDFAGSLNASYQFGASVISLRTSATAGLFDDGFSDYALLYGRATRSGKQRYHASAGLGIGLVDGCRGGGVFSDCRDVSSAVGLPVELQLSWRPGDVLGFALYGFANFNSTQSIAGLTLGLQLGRLR
jgi:hypothetical protein